MTTKKISFAVIFLFTLACARVSYFLRSPASDLPPTAASISLPDTVEEVELKCPRGECVSACLAHVDNEMRSTPLPSYGYLGDGADLVYYGISASDELEKPRKFNVSTPLLPYRENERAHKIIWDYYKTLIPRDVRPDLVTFGVFISSEVNGTFDTTATENWITRINILALERSYVLTDVVAHEYGHYLTLNYAQREHGRGQCKQETLYGCPLPDSYINLFYLEFWRDIYPEWEGVSRRLLRFDEFYQKYQDRFLNEYAATNPVEDIAESWTAFILQPTPSGDSIPKQKINFFYRFPELVKLRYRIIKGICTFQVTE